MLPMAIGHGSELKKAKEQRAVQGRSTEDTIVVPLDALIAASEPVAVIKVEYAQRRNLLCHLA